MNFSAALNLVRETDSHIWRSGWNGKGMYVYYIPGFQDRSPFLMMKTADNMHVPWLASQTDILAEDWDCTE